MYVVNCDLKKGGDLLRRVVVVILIIALIFALPSYGFAETPSYCFLAINETFDFGTSPYFYGSAYVPYTVFGSFKIYSSYFSSSNTVSLYRSDKQLYFNLNSGQVYDGKDNYYSTSTISINNQTYVSVQFICSFFGLNWSYIKGIGYGDILRITDGGQYLSDTDFLYAAASIMQPKYDSYVNSLATPSPTPTEPTSPPHIDDNGNVYFSFEGLPSSTLLDILSRNSVRAAFYLSPEDIAQSPDIVRRINGSGHSIGIYCSTDSAADFHAGSELLFDATNVSTVMVSSSGEGISYCSALADELKLKMGTFNIDAADRAGYGVNAYSVTSRISSAGTNIRVRFDCSQNTERILGTVLSYLNTNNYTLRLECEI